MARAKELKVRTDDRPGLLGEVAAALAEKGVNLRAVNGWIEDGQGVLRLVADKHAVAKKVLVGRGWTPEEQELLEVEVADKPGALAAVAGKLGAAGVNIRHMFLGTAGARKATLFLAVSDVKAATKALR